MGKVLKISATQEGKILRVEINYDKQIWSGLSWGAGEIKHKDFSGNQPIIVRCTSAEKNPVVLGGRLSRGILVRVCQGCLRSFRASAARTCLVGPRYACCHPHARGRCGWYVFR